MNVEVIMGTNPDGSSDGTVVIEIEDCVTVRFPVEAFRRLWEQGGHVLERVKANSDTEG